jgi:hypothetical protein
MRKSQRELLADAQRGEKKIVEVDGYDGLHELLLNGSGNPSQKQLLYSKHEENALVGMVGTSKTSALCSQAWMEALLEPGKIIAIARRDYNKLMITTAKRMEEMLGRLPPGTLVDRDKSAPMRWWVNPIGGGAISQFIFLGLHERPAGLECHSVKVDEADEVDRDVLAETRTRARLRGFKRRVDLAFNPTDEDHYLYTDCTGLNEKGEKIADPIYNAIYAVPGENDRNLYDGYYENMRKTLPPDLIRRLVEGKWGGAIKGTPVYGRVFQRDFHAKGMLAFNKYGPLVRFHDFGYRNPFCIWAQPTAFGGLDVLWELKGENEEIHDWAPRVLAETRTRFPDATTVTDWGDPAANQHKDTGSTIGVLNKHGITLYFIPGAKIEPGLRTVRLLLSRQSGGVPAFRIDSRCTFLIRMLEKGYRYPDEKERKGRKMDEPLKDGVYDHAADALRYGIYGLFGHQMATARGPEDEEVGLAAPGVQSTWSGSGPVLQGSIAYAPSFDPQKMRR